jgi:phosphatidylethanolamine/phosphatidyl-N-methylethanolamine N-methyltransferase
MDYHEIYDRLAIAYDLIFGPLLSHGHKMAIRAMDLKPGMKILEVGIGTGLTLPYFPKDTEIKGIDLSDGMLKKAENRIKKLGMKNVELFNMSAEALTFKNKSFDCVFAPSVLSVVNDPKKVLDEMGRVCKDDGLVCIVSHFAGSTFLEKMGDKFFDPLTNKLVGFRMTTPPEIVEKHSQWGVVLKKPLLPFNFGTLYLLKKKKT